MKRYVKEFARDVIADKNRLMRQYPEIADKCREDIAEIQELLKQCEYGYISDVLAVRLIGEHDQ